MPEQCSPMLGLLADTEHVVVVIKARFRQRQKALSVCAEHVRQLGGESPLHNLMEVK